MIVDHMGRFGTVILTALDERVASSAGTEEKIAGFGSQPKNFAKYLIPSGDEYIVDLVEGGRV
jgi:hypothetical protein